MAEMRRYMDFPFPDGRFPPGLGAGIQRTVLDGERPALYVGHTDENEWVVGDDLSDPNLDGASLAAHLHHASIAIPLWRPSRRCPLASMHGAPQAKMSGKSNRFAWLPDDEPPVAS